MRFVSQKLLGLSLVASAAIADMTPVHAQSFFQQLFGFGSPAAEPQRPTPQSITPGGRPYSFPSNASPGPRRGLNGDDTDDRQSKSPNYRTVCVRMCDGYYFPLSNSTTKKSFFRDQSKCSATCGQEARLFHMPANSMDIDQAVDQQGRIYGYLPIAYKYRKTLVAGCQCKPEPWSEAELARHRQYADAEAAKGPVKSAVTEAQADDLTPAGSASVVVVKAEGAATPQAPTAAALTVVKVAAKVPPAKPRPTLTAQQSPQPIAQAKPVASNNGSVGFSGGMGLGGGQLSWPGDTPKRR